MGKQHEREKDEGGVSNGRKIGATAPVLDCSVCCHPLRRPIFLCSAGHTICSSCHDKLPDKCHFCCLPTIYNRCHMLEDVVESIKVACSNDKHGCTASITYYQKEVYEKDCPHAPCFCPITSCSFSGPTEMLLDHLSGKHKSTSTKIMYNQEFEVRVHGDAPGSNVLVGEDGRLFLVNMAMETLGGVMSVWCIEPHVTGCKFNCKLSLSCAETGYSQIVKFQTRSTNLYDGVPKDFMFLVPKVLLRGATTMVRVTRQ